METVGWLWELMGIREVAGSSPAGGHLFIFQLILREAFVWTFFPFRYCSGEFAGKLPEICQNQISRSLSCKLLKEEDDNLIALPLRDFVDDLRLSVTFDNVNEPPNCIFKDESFRKSFDWDCAFFTNPGLLNVEELCLINKGFKNDDAEQLSSGTRKDERANRVSNVKSVRASNSQNVKLNRSKLQSSSSASFESFKRKITPVKTKSTTSQSHHSYESSSNTSSKSIKKKIVTRKTKVTSSSPSSVLSPLSSPCSSSTSSASHFHNAVSTKSFQTPKLTSQHARSSSTMSSLRMPSQRIGFFDEKLLMSFNISPIFTENCSKVRKVNGVNRQLEAVKPDNNVSEVKGQSLNPTNARHTTIHCSPTPFAEKMSVQGTNLRSVHVVQVARSDNVNAGLNIKLFEDADSHLQPESVEPRKLSLLDKSLDWDRSFFTIAGLLTPEELCMINEGIEKAEFNQTSPEHHMIDVNKKLDESDRCSLNKTQNERMCNTEDKVNGVNRHLDAIKPDNNVTNNVTEVKGQWICTKSGQSLHPPNAGHTTTPCSPTPFSENMSDNQMFGDADSRLQPESNEPRKPIILRESLDCEWDSTFFTSAGLLTPEELWMINGGIETVEFNRPSPKTLQRIFKKAEVNQTSPGTKKHIRSLAVARHVFKDVNLGIHSSTVKKTNSQQSQKLNFRRPIKNRRPNCSIGHKDWFSCLPVDCKV
ncbi:uncharacterized protein [Rutidosis leptorrhynchoides]|uniref:uncharacterized protein n=1 Tax=Rutidosis leptorrhynchoides TaxID=125765 RepID=UPI003A98E63D